MIRQFTRTGRGPVLVLVHGFMSGRQYWNRQIEQLQNDFEIIAFDNQGYGDKTDLPGHDSIERFAADILQQLEALGVERFHLLGHSMGGMIAQEIAISAADRVDKLILFGTGPRGDLPGRFEPLEVSMAKARSQGIEHTRGYTVASWFKAGERDPNYGPGLQMAAAVSLQTFINGLKAMAGWSASGRLERIKAQTLVIWGDLDRSYQWDEQPLVLWQQIPDCHLAVMPDCAHNAHLENPELFNHLLTDFLRPR